jgi:putative transposase
MRHFSGVWCVPFGNMFFVGARRAVPLPRKGQCPMSTGIYNNFTGYHNRKSIRLQEYDYSRHGYYFVTICIDNPKQQIFGNILNGKMNENEFGKIVRDEWNKTAIIRQYVKLDEFIIMPNHIHGIIQLNGCRGTACRAHDATETDPGTDMARRAPTTEKIEQFGKPTVGTIPTIIRSFKSAASKNIHQNDKSFKWQRSYYEHVIRDAKSLYLIRKYIRENPLQWNIDCENHINYELQEYKMVEIGR